MEQGYPDRYNPHPTALENERMRCPDCSHNQKYRDGTRCSQCSYQFVFRKRNDKLSDFTLRQLIQRLSDSGHQAFTATQLALEICRYWRKSYWGPVGYSVLAAIIALAVGFFSSVAVGVGLFLLLLPFAILLARRGKTALPFHAAYTLVERYHQIHPISALANGQAFRQQRQPVELQELQYAPERILVVERDDLVDMLIRNRFHLSHKTAVISRSGYPDRVFAACQEFLRRHPNTPVQVIHDASVLGFNLTAQLASDLKWAFAHSSLVDLGISRAALRDDAHLPWLPSSGSRRGAFSGDAVKMLRTGRRVPIDYIGPKPLMSLLGAALVSGAVLLANPDSAFGGETGVEVDYG